MKTRHARQIRTGILAARRREYVPSTTAVLPRILTTLTIDAFDHERANIADRAEAARRERIRRLVVDRRRSWAEDDARRLRLIYGLPYVRPASGVVTIPGGL